MRDDYNRSRRSRRRLFGPIPKHLVVAWCCVACFLIAIFVIFSIISFIDLRRGNEDVTLGGTIRGVPSIINKTSEIVKQTPLFEDKSQGAQEEQQQEEEEEEPAPQEDENHYGDLLIEDREAAEDHRATPPRFGKLFEPGARIAIGRPYTPFDVLKMTESFIQWGTKIACADPEKTSPWIDVYLYFSQTAADHPHVEEELKKMRAIWDKSKAQGGYATCFGTLNFVDIGTPPEEDVYTAKGQFVRPDWVSGPNIVFRESFHISQTIDDYEIMFFMESDTIPLDDYWLDFLFSEVERYRPFTVLGSSYQADKWDNFLRYLPLSLITHINGNALYNVTCECSKAIMKQMYNEVGTTGNAVAFDYRWMQMVQEATTGLPNEYDPYPDYNVTDPNTDELMVVLRENNVIERMKQIPLFKNYAATNMVPSLFADGIMFQHGARMHQDWDKEVHGDVTLIISDWKGETPHLLTTLKELPSYIDDTIVVVPFGSKIELPEAYESKVRIVYRGDAAVTRDMCSVVINTKWFIVTDSEHRLKPEVPLMMNSKGKIVTPEATIENSQCRNHEYCRVDLAIAEGMNQTNPSVFLPEDFVFHTGLRNEYCKRIMPLFHDERFTFARPSATSYVAYLRSIGVADDYYSFVNIGHYGCRSRFPVSPLVLDERECDIGDPTPTDCNLQITKEECLAVPKCEFRDQYGCRENFDLVVRQLSVPHEKEDPYKILPPLNTSIAFYDELVQKVKEAHEYWLNPDNEEYKDYIPVVVNNTRGDLPDKIFVCADYHEQLVFFPYFEGEVHLLSHKGAMYFDPYHYPGDVQQQRATNLKRIKRDATENSLLMGNVLLLDECLPDAILDFPGKQLLRNTEPQGFNFLTDGEMELYPDWAERRGFPEFPNPENYLPPSDKVFVIGSHEDTATSVSIPYLSFVVAHAGYNKHQLLFNHTMKPMNSKKHFLIYAASHFIDFREEAANKLAKVGGELHTVGKCQGTGMGVGGTCIPYKDRERPSYITISPYDTETRESGVTGNYKMFQNYRFALVLENVKQDGYITEKLINAFLSGTVPIWYGTRDVFQIFNEKAIIYYDIDNPEPALERIAYLEKHPSAYDDMTREPILAAGEETINEWFSIRDEIGNGRLKQRVLDLIGYRDQASTAIFESYNHR